MRRNAPSIRNGSVSRLLISEGTKAHEVDFVAGDALLLEPTQLIQVSVSLGDEKTKKREIDALEAAMKRFGSADSIIVTMDEEGGKPRPLRVLFVWFLLGNICLLDWLPDLFCACRCVLAMLSKFPIPKGQ